jgi:outer membrane murein-binding lipoprotein Lpp
MVVMNPKNYPRWQLIGAGLLMVFMLGACAASKSETAALAESVAKLTAQVAELQKKTDDLAARFEKDQMAKNGRLAQIEEKLDDIGERGK